MILRRFSAKFISKITEFLEQMHFDLISLKVLWKFNNSSLLAKETIICKILLHCSLQSPVLTVGRWGWPAGGGWGPSDGCEDSRDWDFQQQESGQWPPREWGERTSRGRRANSNNVEIISILFKERAGDLWGGEVNWSRGVLLKFDGE